MFTLVEVTLADLCIILQYATKTDVINLFDAIPMFKKYTSKPNLNYYRLTNYASKYGMHNLLKWLINFDNSHAFFTKNVIFSACKYGQIEVLKLLLKHADLVHFQFSWKLFKCALYNQSNNITISLLLLNQITINSISLEIVENCNLAEKVLLLCNQFISSNYIDDIYNLSEYKFCEFKHSIFRAVCYSRNIEAIELCYSKLFSEYYVSSNVLSGLLYRAIDAFDLELFKWLLTKFNQKQTSETMKYYSKISNDRGSTEIAKWIAINYL